MYAGRIMTIHSVYRNVCASLGLVDFSYQASRPNNIHHLPDGKITLLEFFADEYMCSNVQ